MLKFTNIFIVFLLIFNLSARLGYAQEIRTEGDFSYGLSEKFSCGFSYEKRMLCSETIESSSDLIKVNFGFDFNKRLSAGLSYRSKIFEHDGDGPLDIDVNDNQRLTGDFKYDPKLGDDFKLKNRLRFQYSWFDEDDPEKYLRERIIIEKKVSDFFVPYLGFELYYEIDETQFAARRFYLGQESQMAKRIKLETYYFSEKKMNKARSEYAIGLSLKYKL